MKIAVSAKGHSAQDPLDPSFGRCAGFVVYDSDNGSYSFLDNSRQKNLNQGAGIQTAQMLSQAGIAVLISGQIGPKAMQALGNTQIQVFSSSAQTVQEAIDAWQENALQPILSSAGQPGAGCVPAVVAVEVE